MNSVILSWASLDPEKRILVDVEKHIPYDPSLYDDDLHFNVDGYDKLGKLVYCVL